MAERTERTDAAGVKAAEKDQKGRAAEAAAVKAPHREHDLKKLRDLQVEYDEQLELTSKKLVPGTEKFKAALDRKGELTRAMDEIKRRHDFQPSDLEAPGEKGKPESASDEDPVKELNADKAIDAIGRMRSPEKLQQVIDNDQRASVKAAAQKRKDELAAG